MRRFDVIVVGGGHAGCEAAAAAVRLGSRVAMVTLDLSEIGRLSCNPAVGGLGKGHLVREIDALGGVMAQVTDAATIQFRVLNTRKGLAVRSSRAQVDIHRYPARMRATLEAMVGLELVGGEVEELWIEQGRVHGVRLSDGDVLCAPAVILTTGTFLSARMHFGLDQVEGGRLGAAASNRLADCLRDAGLRTGRLKTGTTPRVDARTVDYEKLQPQPDMEGWFSFSPPAQRLPRVQCHLASTNARTHEIISSGLNRSPMYTGRIEGQGPRYCPSIEDKVVRFAHRERHVLFLEPEGLDTHRVYVNGMSTSLPRDIQTQMVRSVEGLENAEVLQYGYAVEYDYADPRDLDHGLQHQSIPGLYLAGQVNGTSGYEEAAAQGLVAGVSAARGTPFELGRHEAYIGVLIDDLVTRGVGGEPYRMFTSRAEHRLSLREDNADRRLMPLAWKNALLSPDVWRAFEARREQIKIAENTLSTPVLPDPSTVAVLRDHGVGNLKKPATIGELLRRPGVGYAQLAGALGLGALSPEVAEQVETDAKYSGYLQREARRAEQLAKMSGISLEGVNFHQVEGLSNEVVHRLCAERPCNLASAGRIPGVTPAAVSLLAVHLARRKQGSAQ